METINKIYVTALCLIGLTLVLLGCNGDKENKNDEFGLKKVQKIEMLPAESPEAEGKLIENNEEIKDFISNLEIEKWRNEKVPSDATKSNVFTMFQEDTVKFGEDASSERELAQIATITTYKESPYIDFQTKNMNFSFKVPKDVAEYLSGLEGN